MTGSGAGAEQPHRVRWWWVARRAGLLAILIGTVATLSALAPWCAQLPQPLGRHLAEWFLRGLLVGYAASLATAALGVVGLAWYLIRGRRRGVRRPIAAQLWLLCASILIGLAAIEVGAATWLSWTHRLPVLPTRFAGGPPGRDAMSIAVIGGSSARGFPDHPRLSVGQIVAWQLEKAMPGRKFDANVLAVLGATLERMHLRLAELKRRPDVLIIYSGHNEFQGRYENTRVISLREAPSDPILGRLYRLSLASPLCRLIYETVSKERVGGPPTRSDEHHLIDSPAYTPSEYAAILADFRRRLEAIVAYCERIGTLPVLVIPPANEGGFEPNRSVLAATASAAERARVARAFASARADESDAPARALAGYRAILDQHPEFAEAQFRAARLFERAGDYASANEHYILARDHDQFPVRCPGPFQEAYREVARRHGCILIDGPAVLRRICPNGILGDDAIHDAHHPTLTAYVALSQALLDALREAKALGWRDGPAPTLDPAEVADHFQIDQGRWELACGVSASAYRGYAMIRYDPTERNAKDRRLTEAARRIAQGTPPEETGVPGVGVRPAVAGQRSVMASD